jgi:arylsulfatase A-like enzyme
VPLVVSWPGHIGEGVTNATHLVSGYDLMPTFSDYAGLKPAPRMVGRSLRPLLEGRAVEGREFVAAEVQVTGRMIRTPDYKYIMYQGDPVEQFFDMRQDPGETRNLAGNTSVAGILADHRKLLKEWEGRLDRAPT